MLSIIPEETQAILIGTSQFPKDQELCPLPGVVNNVNDLANLLQDYQIIGIPLSNVTKILDEASASVVATRLANKAKQATDTLIVYYSGHGLIGKGKNKLVLTVGDTTRDSSHFDGLQFEKVKEAIAGSPATRKLLIIDSCFSGRALMSDTSSYIKERIDIKGTYTIAAVPSNRMADAPEGERYTAFSGKLIDVIQTGIDNQQPFITLETLFEQVKDELVDAGFLAPERSTVHDADKIKLLRNRHYKPAINSSVVFIGDSDDSTVREYRIAAKQCIENASSPWVAVDRQEVCFASEPTPEACKTAVDSCGVYVALLGNFYGQLYEEPEISHTEFELKAAADAGQKIIVFDLPAPTESPDITFIMAQGPLIPRQTALKEYVEAESSNLAIYQVSSPKDLQTQLESALAEISKESEQLSETVGQPVAKPSIASKLQFLGEYSHLSFDRRPVLTYGVQDLDQKLLDFFLTQPQARDALRQENVLRASTVDHLGYLGLLHDDSPALGAFFCFAPRAFLVNKFAACGLALCVYDSPNRGDANASPRRENDNLLNLLEIGMNFLREDAGLSKTGKIGTGSRDDLEIPEIALKEALANALIHREYESQQAEQPTRIDVYPDRVEIISFGEPLVDLEQEPEDIISTKRNHTIAEIFRIMQQVELNASGISRMHGAMRTAQLPPPKIKTTSKPDAVKVIFRRPQRTEQGEVVESDFTLSEIFTGPSGLKEGKPFQAPPLPSYFVDRPEYRDAIKANVLAQVGRLDPATFTSASKPGTLVVSAIYGLGGIGKSVLAAAIAHDREVQSQFPDGIFWVTLGQTPDLLPLLSSWIQALGDHEYKPVTKEAASTHLQTQLYDKRALLVVDDVWNSEDAEYFRVGGAECCVLITTREAPIEGAARYDLDVMTPDQSLKLMSQAIGESLSEAEKVSARTLAKEVGYLPLALELAAAQVEYGATWTEILDDLRAEVCRLESLDRVGTEKISEAKRRKHSLVASFNLSLRQLSDEQRERFAWLGIVPEDVTITQGMAATLWQVSDRQATGILRTFRAKALLLAGARQDDGKLGYRMHDLMHDLAQKVLVSSPEPAIPGELSGLGIELETAHAKLLTAYKRKAKDNLWHTLPDDGYIHGRLTWHLEKAGQAEEVHSLLQETNDGGRNGWYEACDALGQSSYFVTDISRAWNLASSLFSAEPCRAIYLQCCYALMKMSLNSLAQSIPAEMVAALLEENLWQPTQSLAYVQQLQDPIKKIVALEKIFPYLPKSLVPKVRETIAAFQSEYLYAYALRKLSKHLPELLPEALEVTHSIQDEPDRADALRELVKQLPPELLPEALEVTRSIQSESSRASALRELAKHLPELLPEALEVTRSIQSESSRASALRELAKQLPELLPEALEVTRSIQSESSRASALRELAKQLPELLPEALEVT
ncbi:NB-ARC domain-containing protein, partial [Leptothoe sp. LEGE 181152]|nr:NB-ARC domain-containing protein [Leptothoe sp. LEGE 181152]